MVEQHCLSSSSSSSSPPDVVSVYLHYHWESLLTHHQWDQWIHTPLILWILLLLFSIIYPDSLADLTDLLMDGPTAQCCAFAHSFIFVLTWSSCQLIWSVADLFHCLSLITRIVYLHCLPVARATLFCLIQQKVGGRWCSCQIAHLLCVLHVGNREFHQFQGMWMLHVPVAEPMHEQHCTFTFFLRMCKRPPSCWCVRNQTWDHCR